MRDNQHFPTAGWYLVSAQIFQLSQLEEGKTVISSWNSPAPKPTIGNLLSYDLLDVLAFQNYIQNVLRAVHSTIPVLTSYQIAHMTKSVLVLGL